MNKKSCKTNIILLLVLNMFVLSACGTLQIEQVEPAAVVEMPVTPEEMARDELAAASTFAVTAVSPTPPSNITEATATTIPPTPISEALPTTHSVHNGGSDEIIVLPGCFDFDNGLSLAPPDPNCDFNFLPGPDSESLEIYPIAPAQLAYGSVFPEAPTFAQCASSDAFSAEPEVVNLAEAQFDIVCYRTGDNRIGYLHITDADLQQAYTVTLEWLTFSDEQDGGVNPQEMNVVYTNNTFGFTLPLPETWRDYTVTQHDYEGVTNLCFTFVGSAPTCVLQIDVYSQGNWETLEKVPDDYYLGENDLFVFASGPHQEACVQLDDFQCARYQEIPAILTGFISE